MTRQLKMLKNREVAMSTQQVRNGHPDDVVAFVVLIMEDISTDIHSIETFVTSFLKFRDNADTENEIYIPFAVIVSYMQSCMLRLIQN